MNRPASKASPTPRPPQPRLGDGGNGTGPINPKRSKFRELAGKRTANVLVALEVLKSLADNAHRYVAYEDDFLEIETGDTECA